MNNKLKMLHDTLKSIRTIFKTQNLDNNCVSIKSVNTEHV